MVDPAPDRFTWGLQFGQAREKNMGWRIGYQIATPKIAALTRKARSTPPRILRLRAGGHRLRRVFLIADEYVGSEGARAEIASV